MTADEAEIQGAQSEIGEAIQRLRHATVNGLSKVYKWVHDPTAWRRRACDWECIDNYHPDDFFTDTTASTLLHGSPVELPTCPACAALLDLALELRGSR